MDLSFTQTPEWIKERETLWENEVCEFDDDTSRSDIKWLKSYFMTGILPKTKKRLFCSRIEYFPSFTIEGIQFALKNNFPEGVSDEDYKYFVKIFTARLNNIPGVTTNNRAELFKYVFGVTYQANRKFPFLIGDEQEHRPLNYHPNWLLFTGTRVEYWLKSNDEPEHYWSLLLDYFFSLIPEVNPKIFVDSYPEGCAYDDLGGGVDWAGGQEGFYGLLKTCAHYVDPTNGAPEGESRRKYVREFNKRMDNLAVYPLNLKDSWGKLKAGSNE